MKKMVKRTNVRKYARPAASRSSAMVGWYTNLGLMWRVALPFVFIACSFAIGVGAIFSNRTASGDAHEKEDVTTIVFVEADIPAANSEADGACSAAKRDAIWTEA